MKKHANCVFYSKENLIRPAYPEKRQRGISLPVVLMFLLVITLLGTVGIKRATVNERLTRNQLDYEVARQAAETALRDAERDLLIPTGTIRPGAACARLDDRPLIDAVREPNFSTTCLRGQCRFEMTYYDTSNFSTAPALGSNPHPWWFESTDPDLDKGGQWNNDETTKPDGVAASGTNCTFNGAVPLGTFTGTARLAAVSKQPEYIMEYLVRGDDKFMRITARGFGADLNTEVVLQSYFRPYLR